MKELPQQANPGYGFSDTPFGECCVGFSDNGIFSLTFPESRHEGIDELNRRYGCPHLFHSNDKAEEFVSQIFINKSSPAIQLIGTPFQKSIWNELLTIPSGTTSTYQQIAESIGRPKAVRAVGTAIGANPIAFIIPCHRIIRSDGTLGGYKWGVERKMMIIEWELKANK
jgi:AraC family transcriptional regulator, regulatory protein of adaptative response / methylated-DNA-[protein]-cysteine methyltransferase